MSEETMRILRMLEEDKVTAEEAERLIAAVAGNRKPGGFFVPKPPKIPREFWMKMETIPEQVSKAVSAAFGSMATSSSRQTFQDVKHIKMKAVSGTLELAPTENELAIEGSAWPLSVKRENDTVSVNSVNTNLVAELPDDITGTFNLVNTCLSAKKIKGVMRIDSVSADVELYNCTGRWDINSVSGDIVAKNIGGKFTIGTRLGDIEMSIVEPGEYSARLIEGDIEVVLPEDLPATMSIETELGDIDIPESFVKKGESDSPAIFERSGEGETITLSVETVKGDITIK